MATIGKRDELEENAADRAAALIRGAGDLFSIVGGTLVGDAISGLIPNQRIDRIADFARKTDEVLGATKQTVARLCLVNPDAMGVLEECVVQAARAYADDRRASLAQFVKNALGCATFDGTKSARLLSLLAQLSDLELVVLQHLAERRGFSDTSDPTLDLLTDGPPVHTRSSSTDLDAAALAESRKQHLLNVGLLQMTDSGHTATRLGRMLLAHIGIRESADWTE